MSLTAVLLITASAFSHAGWNFISKRRAPSLAFFFVTAVSGALLVLPLLFIFRQEIAQLPPSLWGLILATGAAQLLYFSGLAGAYRRGDISLAYPLARALPVLFVAATSFALGRGAQIGGLGLAGMLLITAGCILLPLPDFRQLRGRFYRSAVYRLALVAAAGTTGYTLLDDYILRQLRADFAPRLSQTEITLFFIGLQVTSTALMLGLGTLLQARERRRMQDLWRDARLLRMGLLTGVVIMSTYGLVLAAMAYVTDVSYVAAFRQLSIPIGALLGMTLAGEPRHRPKLAGVGLVTIGLVLVAF